MHVCSGCHRHVRDTKCPFCKTTIENPVPVAGGSLSRVGMTRAAVVAGALAITGCNGPVALYGIPLDASDQDHSVVALYGIPADSGVVSDVVVPTDTAQSDSGTPTPDGAVAAYGIPPDAGQAVDSGPPGPDGAVAAYGIPPQDAGGH